MSSRKRSARASYRARNREGRRTYDKARGESRSGRSVRDRIIGVDGEGEDTYGPCPQCAGMTAARAKKCERCEGTRTISTGHIYTYLAAVDEEGELVAEAWNPKGLSHDQCAEMLLSIPQRAIKVGFMFSYDSTKIAEGLPELDRYLLVRPNQRRVKVCKACKKRTNVRAKVCKDRSCGSEDLRTITKPRDWRGRSYDFFNGSLTISDGRGTKEKRSTKVWDVFRFFQCAFVKAIEDWKVASPAQLARIGAMKDKRGALHLETPEAVKEYCREECHLLAVMMRRVIDAHVAGGIDLKRYEGAGSSASALLRANEVENYRGPRMSELCPALARAIAMAFSGGRFEDSIVGVYPKHEWGFDISSAYPYVQTFHPCLACGRWRHVTDMAPKRLARLLASKGTLVLSRYHVRKASLAERKTIAWCPLPCRDEDGSIVYGTNFRSWAWGPEMLASLEGWEGLVRLDGEAWIYETSCSHRPFAFLPEVYRRRVAWGKEGPGIALKLASNAVAGKTCQRQGDDPPYQSWIWGGMTNSGTRAQLLQGIMSAKDRWNVHALATDGIYAGEKLAIGAPERDTGTGDLPKPLGGWEMKEYPEGIFLAKPGVYYRLNVKDMADIRARGVGRREIYHAFKRLVAGFEKWDRKDAKHAIEIISRRFYGAKHSIYARGRCSACEKSWAGTAAKGCQTCNRTGDSTEVKLLENEYGEPAYGTWAPRKVRIAFDPHPKRERTGISRKGTFARLTVRDLGGKESKPYDVLGEEPETSPEGEQARDAKDFASWQPDLYD